MEGIIVFGIVIVALGAAVISQRIKTQKEIDNLEDWEIDGEE